MVSLTDSPVECHCYHTFCWHCVSLMKLAMCWHCVSLVRLTPAFLCNTSAISRMPHLDCYTVLVWWLQDCQGGTSTILMWGINSKKLGLKIFKCRNDFEGKIYFFGSGSLVITYFQLCRLLKPASNDFTYFSQLFPKFNLIRCATSLQATTQMYDIY